MGSYDLEFTINVAPITKKNSMQIVKAGNRPMLIPSKQYRRYEEDAGWFIPKAHIETPINVRAIFYMPTMRRVELVNLQEALLDVMVKYGCIEDDNSLIVRSMDGSRVGYDKEDPRTEVFITYLEE